MSTSFTYTARSADGQKHTGEIVADNERRALDALSERPFTVTDIRVAQATFNWRNLFSRGVPREELIIFARHLATFQRSGMPLIRSLALIRVGKPQSRVQAALEDVRQRVYEGLTLSDAMARHPEVFGETLIATVRAGETSGQLPTVLEETAMALEKEMALRRQVSSALRYPVMVVIAITLAMVALMLFAVPRFVTFYSKFGSELPAPTRALIAVSEFMTGNWLWLLMAFIGSVFGARWAYRTPRGRRMWDTTILRAPIFGVLIIKESVARFALLFMIMIRAGIPMVRALTTLTVSVNNVAIRDDIIALRDSLELGRDIDFTGSQLKQFPEMSLHMIKAGLESGSLEMTLGEIANHYSREVEYTSRNLAALIEPILTVAIGALVLILALAIFLPMWNLISVVH